MCPQVRRHIIGPMLDQLNEHLSLEGAAIAHLKLFDRTDSSYLKAGIVHNGDEPMVEGDLLPRPNGSTRCSSPARESEARTTAARGRSGASVGTGGPEQIRDPGVHAWLS